MGKVLGMNARNLVFIHPYNSGQAVKTANNKLATKEKLFAAGLPSAKLFGVIKNRKELFNFDWSSLPSSFVLKPNFGLGGGGIVILYGKDKQGHWISTGENVYDIADLQRHTSNILDGNFSLSNIPDIAYCEERLRLAEVFKNVSYQGVPDIRILVFNSVPVMAMLRLPTKQSDGKANLHLGGIGVGVDLVNGTTTFATAKQLGQISLHPDFNTPLSNIKIPDWDNILRISIEAAKAVGLGYAGVDIVLDKQYGPMILEVNAHPGLEIQNANRITLRDRLDRVAGLTITSATKGLSVCKQLFAKQDGESDLLNPVLGIYEPVTVQGKNAIAMPVRALIDTGLTSTTITKDTAIKLGFTEALAAIQTLQLPASVAVDRAQAAEDNFRTKILALQSDWVDVAAVRSEGQYLIRPKLPLAFDLGGRRLTSTVAVALDNKLSHPMVIGRRDLAGFLINPNRNKK
ncbi:MAG: sugar-transfer associated ATP-grasp domain-containing protein [Patescibacteria group bacterium]|jgi:alpha-L-glutamate ligase-like protein